jgi:hypothetical protein
VRVLFRGRADLAPLKVKIGQRMTCLCLSPLLTCFLVSQIHCERRNIILEQGIQGLPQEAQVKTAGSVKNRLILSWESLLLTGTFCHSFSGIPILIWLIPERGSPGCAGAVQGRADLAPLNVNIKTG